MLKEKEVLLERVETAEGALEKERAAHRKEMRRKVPFPSPWHSD
jgi:hypothetical protein